MNAISRLAPFVAGFVWLFIAMRYFGSNDYLWYQVGGAFALMIAGHCLAIFGQHTAKSKNLASEAQAWTPVILWKVGFILACALFVFYDYRIGTKAAPDTFFEKAMLASYLMLGIISFFAAIGVELSHKSSGRGERAEPARVRRSGMGWGMVGVLLCVLIAINFVASTKDKAYDWSYLKTTSASESTVNMFAALENAITVAVFYSADNEVRPFVSEYFDYLATKGAKMDLKYFDKDLDPSAAETYKASKNGQVVFELNGKRERISVGTGIKKARDELKKLDVNVQKSLLRLTQERKTVYFTRGHGEMSWTGSKDPVNSLRALRQYLRSQNYSLRNLGATDGLGSEIPDDADAVVVMGPKEPFLPAEAAAVKSYIERGGKVMVFFDVAKSTHDGAKVADDGKRPLVDLFSGYGLSFRSELLANDKVFLKATRSPLDKSILLTNSFSTHESVSSLSRREDRTAVALLQSGHIQTKDKVDGWKTYSTVRSMQDTFVDLNKNYDFDKDEKRKSYTIGAAAKKTFKGEGENAPSVEAKIVMLADANVVSDFFIRNAANLQYYVDSLKWLVGETKATGTIASSEEDVQIRHSNKEDLVWFISTVAGMPALVLVAGFAATRRRRRRS